MSFITRKSKFNQRAKLGKETTLLLLSQCNVGLYICNGMRSLPSAEYKETGSTLQLLDEAIAAS